MSEKYLSDRLQKILLMLSTYVNEPTGMQHDFKHTSGRPSRKDSSGNNCKGIAAFMVCHQEVHCMKSQSCNIIDVFFYSQDYIFPPYTTSNPMPNKWSGCSVDDFKVHYQLFKNTDGIYCLEGNAPQRKSSTNSFCFQN